MKINKDNIDIINYKSEYKEKFKELSYEWLYKYELFEPEDELILNHPEKYILAKGGFIFLAKFKDEVIATISLIPKEDNIFELAKLAVTEKYQKNGIAKILLNKAIQTAKKQDAEKIILYSNSKLKKAYQLYKNFGFEDVKIGETVYETADVKMELKLN